MSTFPPGWVDLFAGVGGLDQGAAIMGQSTTGLELDPDACLTRRAVGLPTIQADVRRHGPADFPNAGNLCGGPPCQTYSATGNGSGRRDLDEVLAAIKRLGARQDVGAGFADDRTGLVLEPLRWALAAVDSGRPYRHVVLEQVPTVLPVWKGYADVLAAEGYSVAVGVLAAEQYGVPQTRRRAVLIARRDGVAVLPPPTHRPYVKGVPQDAGDPALLPWVSMGEALDRPEPFTVISNYGTGGNPKNRGRRTSREPAATVTGKISRFRIVGPDDSEQARFTWSEAGRLQTFPADYPWAGRDIGQQIGNAVPPLLAAHLIAAATGLPAPQTTT